MDGFAVTRALCARDDVDVVDLCTPPYLHVPQILQTLRAGKHVICEKPLGGSLADVDRVAAAEKRSGRRVMPIFQYRFGHGAMHNLPNGLRLVDSYHCSRYNTQTGVLTEAMFREVIGAAREAVAP